MSKSDRPKPRTAPSMESVVRSQQESVAALAARSKEDTLASLAALDEWTEKPNEPPQASIDIPVPGQAAPTQEAAPQPEQKPAAPESGPPAANFESRFAAGRRPWESVGPNETQAFHVILPKRLRKKVDYVWKRAGMESAKDFVILALEKTADEILIQMGEEP